MKRSLEGDLKYLEKLAFNQKEFVKKAIERFWAARPSICNLSDFELVENAYEWLLSPRTLWPIRCDQVVEEAVAQLESKGKLDQDLLLLLDTLGNPPPEKLQSIVVPQELLVQEGSYEGLINAQHKFDEIETLLAKTADLMREWTKIKSRFDIRAFSNARGVIRRTMVQERNFRINWDLKWKSKEAKFHAIFDAFCHRWDLYGMEGDKPLLLKATVNLTPYGTLIMIPKYWSIDGPRDFKWGDIAKLHKARGVQKQGPKLSPGRKERANEAVKARQLWDEVTKSGLRGLKRTSAVISKLGWDPRTDPSKLSRLLKQNRKVNKASRNEGPKALRGWNKGR